MATGRSGMYLHTTSYSEAQEFEAVIDQEPRLTPPIPLSFHKPEDNAKSVAVRLLAEQRRAPHEVTAQASDLSFYEVLALIRLSRVVYEEDFLGPLKKDVSEKLQKGLLDDEIHKPKASMMEFLKTYKAHGDEGKKRQFEFEITHTSENAADLHAVVGVMTPTGVVYADDPPEQRDGEIRKIDGSGTVFVAFRGSHEAPDWGIDFNICTKPLRGARSEQAFAASCHTCSCCHPFFWWTPCLNEPHVHQGFLSALMRTEWPQPGKSAGDGRGENRKTSIESLMEEVNKQVNERQEKKIGVLAKLDGQAPEEELDKVRVLITGHSLGGAVATIFANEFSKARSDVPVNLVTIGSPRVGTGLFRREFNARRNLRYLRIQNKCDCGTQMPLQFCCGFVHVGDHLWIVPGWIAYMSCLNTPLVRTVAYKTTSAEKTKRCSCTKNAKGDEHFVERQQEFRRDKYGLPWGRWSSGVRAKNQKFGLWCDLDGYTPTFAGPTPATPMCAALPCAIGACFGGLCTGTCAIPDHYTKRYIAALKEAEITPEVEGGESLFWYRATSRRDFRGLDGEHGCCTRWMLCDRIACQFVGCDNGDCICPWE